MLEDAELTAFVATTSFARARAFYRDTLGLLVLSEDSFALVFDCHGTQLRVSLVEQIAPAPYTVMGWKVADIEPLVERLSARGVRFNRYPFMPQDGPAIWTSPDGSKVAWFSDPDGNTLSLTQVAG